MWRFALLFIAFLPLTAIADTVPRQIVVSATGSAEAAPDMATLRLGITREATTAEEAMREMADAAEKLLEEVASAGIAASDVQTTSINLNPIWEQSGARPQQIRGYAAATQVNLKVRNLDDLGALLDMVVAGGVNQLNGLRFGIADLSPLEAEARADGVLRARAMAETLAIAADVTLGDVVTILESSNFDHLAPMMRGAVMEAAAVPVASGELSAQVTVTMTFEITQ
ncbi:MAG: SIMPL domain-containing protein [Pseudomonadota bacterium]